MSAAMNPESKTVLVCCGTGCIASGSLGVAESLREELSGTNISVIPVKETGCNGFCENGPIVRIKPDDITYYKVRVADAREIASGIGGEPVERLLYKGPGGDPVRRRDDNPFFAAQRKIVLKNVGEIDPGNIKDYIERGGYEALKKAITMSPDRIIREIETSGLRGRGGAGFPTGRKWRMASGYESMPKYVICNGDEGDPGAFMDRSIFEGDPHSVIEGMAICALAIGAEEGFLYIRDEYSLALKHVTKAIEAAEEAGIIGDSILNSGKPLRLSIVRGGGAFVCGESTALMASIEGRVGEPRAKYIRSVQKGLWDQPTVLNNVETFANIPIIISGGGENFAATGTEKSKGTKVFALVGKVKRTGLIEVPMGITLRHLIYEIGGGVLNGRPFKAVQIGGPSGGLIPAELLDLPVDFDTLTDSGAMMGSGGLIVMDDRSCIVEVARYYVNFLAGESCGKCSPCREGLWQMLRILTDICEGRGKEDDIALLAELGSALKAASLCALGKTAANPVLSAVKYFEDEFGSHIRDKYCPAGVCPALTLFEIDQEKCTGCTLCRKVCPVSAVKGEAKSPHSIDKKTCIACGSCRDVCRFEAVNVVKRGPA